MAAERNHSVGGVERVKADDATGLEIRKQGGAGDSKAPVDTSTNSAEHGKSQGADSKQRDAADSKADKQGVAGTDMRDKTTTQGSVTDIVRKAAEDPQGTVGADNVPGQLNPDQHALTAAETGDPRASNPFYPWERKMDDQQNWPYWINHETNEWKWVEQDANGNPYPVPDKSLYDTSVPSNSAHNGEYGNSYGYDYGSSSGGQYANAYGGQYGSAYAAGAYAAAGHAAPSTDTNSSSAKPKRLYGGYNPAIHGSYDPNADYAKEAEREEEEAEEARRVAELIAAGVPPPPATISVEAHFNQIHGRFQDASTNPELHNDENKSHRQMNAFFDVNTAANQHDGRSLKEERRNQKLSKKELMFYKKRNTHRKKEKYRKFWMDS